MKLGGVHILIKDSIHNLMNPENELKHKYKLLVIFTFIQSGNISS